MHWFARPFRIRFRALVGGPALALALALAVPAGASNPGPVPVWDSPEPFLALVLGAIDGDWEGRMTGGEIQRAIQATGKPSDLPLEELSSMSRRLQPGTNRAQWIITFHGKQSLPVPYSVLGYHPGHVDVSETLVLDEWKVGNFVFSWGSKEKPSRVALREVTLWAIDPGSLFMNVDGWLDALLGDKVDDTHIVGFALFRHRNQRYVMALGYNTEGDGASGVVHLNRDEILFPYPEQYQRAAWQLRARLEHLAPRAVAPYRTLSPRR